jgi:glycosyltransferase involved in cell wall biosynthesis
MVTVPITAIVLARDEAELIGRCLTYLDWAEEVLVVDSGSTDGTPELARAHGATVLHQPWLGWSAQRMAGAQRARHDWVLFVEADEVVTRELAEEIACTMSASPHPDDGFTLDRRNEFLGTLLPNSQRKAARRSFVRLFNRTRSGYDVDMLVHEQVLVRGRVHDLRGPLLHWRRQDTEELVARMNRYATIEVDELRRVGVRGSVLRLLTQPILRFLWHLIVKGELRSGRRGVIHAGLRACADYVRLARLLERDLPPAPVHPPGHPPKEPARHL